MFTNLFSCVFLKEPCGVFEVFNILLVVSCQANDEMCAKYMTNNPWLENIFTLQVGNDVGANITIEMCTWDSWDFLVVSKRNNQKIVFWWKISGEWECFFLLHQKTWKDNQATWTILSCNKPMHPLSGEWNRPCCSTPRPLWWRLSLHGWGDDFDQWPSMLYVTLCYTVILYAHLVNSCETEIELFEQWQTLFVGCK